MEAKHHHCFRRTCYIDEKSATKVQKYHRYILLSLARPETSGVDIYLYFFPSAFAKKHHEPLAKPSYFFISFTRLFLLKSLFYRSQRSTRDEISYIIEEQLFRNKRRDKETRILLEKAKEVGREVESAYSETLGKGGLNEEKISSMFSAYAVSLNEKINAYLNEFAAKVHQTASELIKNEYLPENLTEHKLTQIVVSNLKSINNLQILRQTRKLALVKELKQLYSAIELKIPLIDSFNTEKETRQIIIRSFINERQPILISMADLAVHQNINWQKEMWIKLAESLISCCLKFREDSGRFLAGLTASDAFFDQRKLKAGLVFDKVILEALGLLHPEIKSLEAKLCLDPTAFGVGEEDCWHEHDASSRVKLHRKYYLNQREDEQKDWEDIQESVHVWRLIDLLYFVRHGAHLAQHQYQRQYPTKPFSLKAFQQTRKKLYNDIEEGRKQILDMLCLDRQFQNQKEKERFKFSLSGLKSLVREQEDSMIERLRWVREEKKLENRAKLFDEVYELLVQDDFFRGFINPRKYITLLLLCYFEEMHHLLTVHCSLANAKPSLLIEQRKKRKGHITTLIKKIDNYKQGDDPNSKYINNKGEIVENIFAIHTAWERITSLESEFQKQQLILQQMKDEGHISISQVEESLSARNEQLAKDINKTMESAGNELRKYIDNDLRADVMRSAKAVHKPRQNQNSHWFAYGSYLSRRLLAVLEAELLIDSENWLTCSAICINTLGYIAKKPMDRFRATSPQKAEVLSEQLRLVEQWLAHQINERQSKQKRLE